MEPAAAWTNGPPSAAPILLHSSTTSGPSSQHHHIQGGHGRLSGGGGAAPAPVPPRRAAAARAALQALMTSGSEGAGMGPGSYQADPSSMAGGAGEAGKGLLQVPASQPGLQSLNLDAIYAESMAMLDHTGQFSLQDMGNGLGGLPVFDALPGLQGLPTLQLPNSRTDFNLLGGGMGYLGQQGMSMTNGSSMQHSQQGMVNENLYGLNSLQQGNQFGLQQLQLGNFNLQQPQQQQGAANTGFNLQQPQQQQGAANTGFNLQQGAANTGFNLQQQQQGAANTGFNLQQPQQQDFTLGYQTDQQLSNLISSMQQSLAQQGLLPDLVPPPPPTNTSNMLGGGGKGLPQGQPHLLDCLMPSAAPLSLSGPPLSMLSVPPPPLATNQPNSSKHAHHTLRGTLDFSDLQLPAAAQSSHTAMSAPDEDLWEALLNPQHHQLHHQQAAAPNGLGGGSAGLTSGGRDTRHHHHQQARQITTNTVLGPAHTSGGGAAAAGASLPPLSASNGLMGLAPGGLHTQFNLNLDQPGHLQASGSLLGGHQLSMQGGVGVGGVQDAPGLSLSMPPPHTGLFSGGQRGTSDAGGAGFSITPGTTPFMKDYQMLVASQGQALSSLMPQPPGPPQPPAPLLQYPSFETLKDSWDPQKGWPKALLGLPDSPEHMPPPQQQQAPQPPQAKRSSAGNNGHGTRIRLSINKHAPLQYSHRPTASRSKPAPDFHQQEQQQPPAPPMPPKPQVPHVQPWWGIAPPPPVAVEPLTSPNVLAPLPPAFPGLTEVQEQLPAPRPAPVASKPKSRPARNKQHQHQALNQGPPQPPPPSTFHHHYHHHANAYLDPPQPPLPPTSSRAARSLLSKPASTPGALQPKKPVPKPVRLRAPPVFVDYSGPVKVMLKRRAPKRTDTVTISFAFDALYDMLAHQEQSDALDAEMYGSEGDELEEEGDAEAGWQQFHQHQVGSTSRGRQRTAKALQAMESWGAVDELDLDDMSLADQDGELVFLFAQHARGPRRNSVHRSVPTSSLPLKPPAPPRPPVRLSVPQVAIPAHLPALSSDESASQAAGASSEGVSDEPGVGHVLMPVVKPPAATVMDASAYAACGSIWGRVRSDRALAAAAERAERAAVKAEKAVAASIKAATGTGTGQHKGLEGAGRLKQRAAAAAVAELAAEEKSMAAEAAAGEQQEQAAAGEANMPAAGADLLSSGLVAPPPVPPPAQPAAHAEGRRPQRNRIRSTRFESDFMFEDVPESVMSGKVAPSTQHVLTADTNAKTQQASTTAAAAAGDTAAGTAMAPPPPALPKPRSRRRAAALGDGTAALASPAQGAGKGSAAPASEHDLEFEALGLPDEDLHLAQYMHLVCSDREGQAKDGGGSDVDSEDIPLCELYAANKRRRLAQSKYTARAPGVPHPAIWQVVVEAAGPQVPAVVQAPGSPAKPSRATTGRGGRRRSGKPPLPPGASAIAAGAGSGADKPPKPPRRREPPSNSARAAAAARRREARAAAAAAANGTGPSSAPGRTSSTLSRSAGSRSGGVLRSSTRSSREAARAGSGAAKSTDLAGIKPTPSPSPVPKLRPPRICPALVNGMRVVSLPPVLPSRTGLRVKQRSPVVPDSDKDKRPAGCSPWVGQQYLEFPPIFEATYEEDARAPDPDCYPVLTTQATDTCPDICPGDSVASALSWLRSVSFQLSDAKWDAHLFYSHMHRYLPYVERARVLEQVVGELSVEDGLAHPDNLPGPRPPSVEERRAARHEAAEAARVGEHGYRPRFNGMMFSGKGPVTRLLVGSRYQAELPPLDEPPPPVGQRQMTPQEVALLGIPVMSPEHWAEREAEAAARAAAGAPPKPRTSRRAASAQAAAEERRKRNARVVYPPDQELCANVARQLSVATCLSERHKIMDETVKELDHGIHDLLPVLGLVNVGSKARTGWTAAEEAAFAAGLRDYDREFESVQKHFLPHKSIAQIVSYYYNVWKIRYTPDSVAWHEERTELKALAAEEAALARLAEMDSDDDY